MDTQTILDQTKPSRQTRSFWLAFLIIAIAFVALRLPFVSREYAPEEPLWVTAGEGVAQTGFPLASLGENKKIFPAYWKPPMLPLALGSAYKLFGSSEIVSRGLMLFISLLQLPLILLLCRRLFGTNKGTNIALTALALIAISPFAIQNALYVEADATLLTFFLLLLALACWPIAMGEKISRKRWLAVMSIIILALFCRIETTLMVLFALALITLWRANIRRTLQLIAASSIALLLFFILYYAYAAAFGHPEIIKNGLSMVVSSLLIRGQTDASQGPLNIASYLPGISLGPLAPFVAKLFPAAAFTVALSLWLTLPFIFLFLLSVFRAIRRTRDPMLTRRNQRTYPRLYLIVLCVTIFTVYGITGAGANWPRQIYIGFILASILIAALLIEFELFSKKYLRRALGITIVLLILFWLTPLRQFAFFERVRESPIKAGIVAGLIILAACLIAFWKTKLIRTALLVGLSGYAAISILLIAHDIQRPYTLTAYYGNHGYKAAGAYLQKQVKPGETVAAVEVIGYYSRRPYYDIIDLSWFTLDPDWVAVYNLPAGRFNQYTQNKKLVATFGTVKIYRAATR